MIEVTPDSIELLSEKLFLVQREIQSCIGRASEFKNPMFVLLAKDESARLEIEKRVLDYFARKYGFNLEGHMVYDINPLKNSSTFHFPNGVALALITLP